MRAFVTHFSVETLQREFEERVTRFVALLRPRDTIAEKYPHGLLIRRNNMVDACHAVLIVLLGVGEVNETVSLPTRMRGTRLSTRCHASVRSRRRSNEWKPAVCPVGATPGVFDPIGSDRCSVRRAS